MSSRKICTKCKKRKTTSMFYKQKRCKGGLNPRCKSCVNKANRAWAKAHPENMNTNSQKWRDNNPEAYRESAKESAKKWRVENREAFLEAQRKSDKRWRDTDPEAYYAAKQRASQKYRLKKKLETKQ